MFRLLPLLGLAFQFTSAKITWIEAKFPLGGNPSPPGSPWPYPQEITFKNVLLGLDPGSFQITSNANSCDIISEAIKRYDRLIFIIGKNVTSTDKKLKGLAIQVEDFNCSKLYPQLGDNENYTLVVEEAGAKLNADSVWGALRGLETFSQLVFVNEDSRTYHINETSIEDWPTFSYRGILLDTARHYQPIKILKQNLDSMSYNKMNVFHWHIVDDQSWPFESIKYPNLTKLGAYHPRLIYTRKDIQEIIDYARLRGIRVMPEFDTPGHTLGLGKAFENVITKCYGDGVTPGTANYTEHAEMEILNPSLNETYDLVKDIFQEFKELFVDEYVHLGMDEVYYACWESNPDIRKFMEDNGLKTINDLEQYYVERTIKNVREIGYKYMSWQDPVDNDVDMDNTSTILQIWKDSSLDVKLMPWHDYIRNISKKGYKMVVSACWYLNYISYGMDWKKYYNCDPQGFDAEQSVKDLVIGGEACLWGEYVDGTNLISRLWPRASAVAERLWGRRDTVNNTDDAQYRLDEQRCRMLRRGIPTSPILNGYCGDYEWDLDGEKEPVCEKPEKCKECPGAGYAIRPYLSVVVALALTLALL